MQLVLKLDRLELAILALHMNIMRKSVKKGFKANYGLLEGRKKIKLYDDIKEKISEGYDEEMDIVILPFSVDEIDMLSSFMNFYVLELKLAAEIETFNIKNNEVLRVLEIIKDRVCALEQHVTNEALY
ncbi:hypothetical protein J27TS8_27580 [Robertmurraya siralis]|uniref:Uncharacterized protein n=1 Tax=Robertmurraya siralis TaxID=77777 RepID=A0A920BU17_9BACI|nr:hypothetical protein [Robertmurraya siralis]GIN62765.1 hypothetical protein J27TS8_27580 [Robertmurraya siralis]